MFVPKVRTSDHSKCDTGAGSYTFLGCEIAPPNMPGMVALQVGLSNGYPTFRVSRRRRSKVATKMTYTIDSDEESNNCTRGGAVGKVPSAALPANVGGSLSLSAGSTSVWIYRYIVINHKPR